MKKGITTYLIFCLGVFLSAFGIALTAKANMGLTPIACLPYILCLATPLTFGMNICIVNIIFVLSQVAILRSDFEKFQYFQFFLAFLLGFFIDVSMYLLKAVIPEMYVLKLAALLVGCIILGFGISLQIKQNLLLVPGDGIVKAIAGKLSKEFGYIKIVIDVIIVIIACILSLVFIGTVEGIREGTIILAVLTGLVVKFFLKNLNNIKA